MPVPTTIGVVGAGTMGAGIAQLAALAGARTLVHDPDGAALERGLGAVARRLEREVERERLDPAAVQAVRARLQPVSGLADLAPCGLVIEAAPERPGLKQELFRSLDDVVGQDCVLATNTSSLSVTELAAASRHPERVVGMHFFNPAPVMRLLEVVAGEASSREALAVARETGRAMGKHVIDAADGPGFLVNRCNRPFALEALRIVQEGLAEPAQVDRVLRMAGGFRMGPFELMDLVGLDVGFEVAQSFWRQSFGEPRWRPSPLVARLVAAGRTGRKSGRGWYAYPDDGGPHRPPDPEPPPAGGGDGVVVVAGETALAAELLDEAVEAGWDARTPSEAEGVVPALIVDCGAAEDDPPLQGGPQVLLCDSAPLAALDPQGPSAGFMAVLPLAGSSLVELTRSPTTSEAAALAAERFFASLGRHAEWVADGPGLILGRVVAQLVNEACFALGEGVGSAADIDAGMVLGLNHPRGPLEWADSAGAGEVLAILTGLHAEYGEERYRPAPRLVRAARTGEPLSAAA